ncbi:hypothetical protein Ga0074812_106365 [Parafrankia irregularis]|uniref:Uncharacterized protein n=1 Tax=Parafrankia irregularis TaxID=795642 RepID=A0A0S4QLY9_9ACTN|nr:MULTISPECIES: hypothetical protein [Parafrankia]MBE3202357.1 hypothetical protein [Parafrankia sp. CH37]CUU56110.1 hypothetical protein Ga0074812_106365 [Parafrankia irregularis]
MNEREGAFHGAMLDICRRASKDAGYRAGYFLQMVEDVGGVAAAIRLIGNARPSEGFTALWERGRLDLTVEAAVLDPRFSSLFSDDDLDAARDRLRQCGFRVDARPGRSKRYRQGAWCTSFVST